LHGNTILYAQTIDKDSVVTLKEVNVYGSRLVEFDAGVKVIKTDSLTQEAYRHNNLSSLLEQNSNIYIKSYGLGSLSTTSFRGAGASQTSVLWNGFNLQSPMNGVLDLALVPVSLVDQVKVQFGGCGALWGSGSVSGSIHLDNQPVYNKGLTLRYGTEYGSFGNTSQIASLSLSKKKAIISVKGFFNEAKNNFVYTNTTQFEKPKTTQSNAALQQYGYMLDNYFKLTKRDQLSIRVWQQYSNREIPPTMLVNFSDAIQKDWFLRISSEWQHSRTSSTWNIRLAYFDENLIYRELSKNINSLNRSICQISEAETKFLFLKILLMNVGINNTYSTAKVDAYQGQPYQNRTALFTSLKYLSKKNNLKINGGLRKEVITGSRYSKLFIVPLMPFAGMDLNLTKKIILKSNVSRNYRLPTFNDLYWVPGGNIDLLPEQGWSEELGLNFIHKNKECSGDSCSVKGGKLASLNISSTFFNRNINNWIMWIPDGNYWVPRNVLSVWSRGIENEANLSLNFNPFKVELGVRYDYVLSTNEKVPQGNESELKKQLIYVPLHKGGMKIGLGYKGYGIRYLHNYTGWVYTQADNKDFINAYWIGNVILSKTYFVKKMSVNLLFKINNVWNKPYQVIAYRPMPGRNFEIGMSIQYNNKK
jgi:vitamin B12 transporter